MVVATDVSLCDNNRICAVSIMGGGMGQDPGVLKQCHGPSTEKIQYPHRLTGSTANSACQLNTHVMRLLDVSLLHT